MLNTKAKIRIARVLSKTFCTARRAVGARSTIERVRRSGFEWSIDLAEGIDLAIYLGVYERETTRAIRRLVRAGSLVLDIGANRGAHTLELARQVGPTGRVIAFEPTATTFARLRHHLSLNPTYAARVVAEQIMLAATSDAEVEPAIYSRWPLDVREGLNATHQGKLESTAGARAVTLDDYLRTTLPRTRVDFIKLDVDGFECDVLEGGRDCLDRMQPTLVLELAPDTSQEHERSLAELVGKLTRAGYRLYDLRGAALPTNVEAIERLIPRGGGMNVTALVPGRRDRVLD